MSKTRRDVERLLSKEEQELVELASHPQLARLPENDLSGLARRLREARDRAQTIARRQRREMRGKAAPSGTKPASDNTASVEKSALLAAATQRVNKETNRRRSAEGKPQLADNAQKALKAKQAAPDPAETRPETRTANEGMRSLPVEGMPPSGALEQEGQRVVLERSRKVR